MTKLLFSVAFAFAAATGSAAGQSYPSRPITLVAPYAAGGPVDTVARIVSEHMRASLGQPVIVENVSGANGSIGVGRVARASPDGYTICYGPWATHVVNPAVYSLPYDVLRDFEPVSLIARSPWLIAAKKAMPADDLGGLITWLKANPGKASAATSGIGSPGHVGAVLFQTITGTRFQLVPYRGNAPAIQDMVAGQIDLMIVDPVTSLPQWRAGNVRIYANLAKTRSAAAPEIPTVEEAGVPGLHVAPWQAIWAPRGTPKDVIGKLNAAVISALADPSVRTRLADLGQEIPAPEEQTPEALGALHKAEIEKWWPIIRAAGIKAE